MDRGLSKPRVYLETTIVSYLTARPSRDLLVAARQQITSSWWNGCRHGFECFVSELVIREAGVGDPGAVARRTEVLNGIQKLGLTEEALVLAERLVSEGAVPKEAGEDALHIAIAAANGMDYLVTWNCRHIANATMRNSIAEVCVTAGYESPVICTPEELGEE